MLLLLLACTPDLPSSGSFSTLIYNVQGLPAAITGTDTPGRMVQIAPLLAPYDLIGLQEDFDDANHEVLVGEAPHPYQERFAAEVEPDRVYGSGLSLLSKAEILEAEGVHYSTCYGGADTGSGDCLASKGFQWTRIAFGEGEIDVLNTHMEAGGGDQDNAARLVHAQEITEYALEKAQGRTVLIIGDTNLHGGDEADLEPLQVLWDAGFEDVCDMVGCADPGRIDRVLLRPGDINVDPTGWRLEEGFFGSQGEPLSDHEPIVVEMDWELEP